MKMTISICMPQPKRRLKGNARERNFQARNKSFDSLSGNKNHILKINLLKKSLSNSNKERKPLKDLCVNVVGHKNLVSSSKSIEGRRSLESLNTHASGRKILTTLGSSVEGYLALEALSDSAMGRRILATEDLSIIKSFIRKSKKGSNKIQNYH
ncbi:MAG: hypothetical protein PHP82_02465 [Candidatus ainarchaeum sp.]|nr:hypothetical protein [Candidatus ainarchaeum sp.]